VHPSLKHPDARTDWMDGPGLAEQEQVPKVDDGRSSIKNYELWCPPVGAWDFPMSRAEKVRRLLLVFGAEAETTEKQTSVLQQERDKWRARAKAAEAVLEPLSGAIAEERSVAAEALDKAAEAAEAAKAVLSNSMLGEMSLRPPALSVCSPKADDWVCDHRHSGLLIEAMSPQAAHVLRAVAGADGAVVSAVASRLRPGNSCESSQASLCSPEQSSPSRMRMANLLTPQHSSPSRMRRASLRSPHHGSPPQKLPSNQCSPQQCSPQQCSPQHGSPSKRLTVQQLQWPPPRASLLPESVVMAASL